ncbi:Glycoside hydrolase superfamily [Penicillium cf. griseofulvum]|uniref:Glycoside hydrolase superfamily n=1 Tax=Penicillium cf. griseofulvum TaxID=2972120 RepID=A0A9W9MSM0_9EURO|nr:Glycoside hydrolase superfamily [Penicillium cf. griseofulvum]KAJ5440339.1 Glycoside hydrolase superfamily [Penicillium cf. griseofulvum]
MSQFSLRVEGQTFRDPLNREIILRGINVAGDAKYPQTPDLRSHNLQGFFDADVSFVGRPFSLGDADMHFKRLRKWGYNTIRYIFTWEAIEHAGPKIYDEEWIDSTIEILRVAKKYKFYIFMDPHQDVWSRLSGGSGAPTWTLYAAGLNPKNFKNTQAALVHNTWDNPAEFPKMLWCTNYTRLACQTMFTLFWAGRDFAPKAVIDGVNIQDYLQSHFIAACEYLAQRIQSAGGLEGDVVIGWESINEPNKGLIGIQDISSIPPEQHLQLGTSPTVFQGMIIGSGRSCKVKTWSFGGFGPYQTGTEVIDPKGELAWLSTEYDDSQYGWHRDPGWRLGECLWAQHGVWDPSKSKPSLLQKDYFSRNPLTGEILDYEGFTNSYFLNHYRAYKQAIRRVCGSTIMFCQPPVMELPPSLKGTADDDPNMVHAVHFYDGLTLITKHWNRLYNMDVIGLLRGKYLAPAFAMKIGERSIRKSLRHQLRFLREESLEHMGDHPLIFTEIGIPYDMNDKHAYKTGDYRSQIRAMDANHFALEGSKSNGFALWVYMAGNDHEWGDQWNGEDLSIFSPNDLEFPIRSIIDAKSPDSTDRLIDLEERELGSLENLTPRCSLSDLSQVALQPQQGYRAAEAYIRPTPIYTNGRLKSYAFDLKKCTFTMRLIANQTAPHTPSEIYLPEFHFPMGETSVMVSGGRWEICQLEFRTIKVQYLRWWHGEGKAEIKIWRTKRTRGEYPGLQKLHRTRCMMM